MMEFEFLFAFSRVVGYFILSYATAMSATYMRRVWYMPAVLSLWFAVVGISLLLSLIGYGVAGTFITSYVVTFCEWGAVIAVGAALFRVSKRGD